MTIGIKRSNTGYPKYASVAEMKTVAIPAGHNVETVAYYSGWAAAGDENKGAGVYNIVTSSEFTAITGLAVPDEKGDFVLINGNVAYLQNNLTGVSVFQCGAVGDGVTDDSVYVQAAVNRLSKGGAVVFDVNSVFVLSDINCGVGVSMVGSSRSKTDACRIIGGDVSKPIFNVVGASLTFFGMEIMGLYFNGGNSSCAIYLSNATNLKIRSNSFHALSGNAILTDKINISNTVEISNNYINQSNKTQLDLEGLNDSVISENLIQQGLSVTNICDGVVLGTYNRLVDNYITLNQGHNVKVVGWGNIITGNNIVQAKLNGIYVNITSSDITCPTITGNNFLANGTSEAAPSLNYSDLHLVKCTLGIVKANMFQKSTSYGDYTIRVDAGVTSVQIIGNNIRAFSINTILNNGSGIRISHNNSNQTSPSTESHDGFTCNDSIVFKSPQTIASADTLDLGGKQNGNVFNITGTTAINNISSGDNINGRLILLKFSSGLLVGDGGNLRMAGNFSVDANDILMFINISGIYYEISRSSN